MSTNKARQATKLKDEKRVVVTGLGIVSCLGNDAKNVAQRLRMGESGIRHCEQMMEAGLNSQVCGFIDSKIAESIHRKKRRFMNDGAAFTYLALQAAIEDAALPSNLVSHPRTGLIAGSGGTSTQHCSRALDLAREKGIKKIGPYAIIQTMTNAISACLSVAVGIQGVSYSLSAACATSANSIGHATALIRSGAQDVMFAGGGEELHWLMSAMFDAMGALTTSYNTLPEQASRPFDKKRDGFVVSGGGGILVLESLAQAKKRKAQIYAEITGFGTSSDGDQMVAPNNLGAVRAMQGALAEHRDLGHTTEVDYINAHATSTQAGDSSEIQAIEKVFDQHKPSISSTKSLSGHALGAAGVHEAIYTLLMMREGFIAASANIDTPDFDPKQVCILREKNHNKKIQCALSNSFGFGGTNASLLFTQYCGG